MKKRWKDRIEILTPCEKTYDAWGHQSTTEFERVTTVWADVCPILSKIPAAVVTVRMPFEVDHNVYIHWQDQQWKIVQGPTYFPTPGLAQFKIEKI